MLYIKTFSRINNYFLVTRNIHFYHKSLIPDRYCPNRKFWCHLHSELTDFNTCIYLQYISTKHFLQLYWKGVIFADMSFYCCYLAKFETTSLYEIVTWLFRLELIFCQNLSILSYSVVFIVVFSSFQSLCIFTILQYYLIKIPISTTTTTTTKKKMLFMMHSDERFKILKVFFCFFLLFRWFLFIYRIIL